MACGDRSHKRWLSSAKTEEFVKPYWLTELLGWISMVRGKRR